MRNNQMEVLSPAGDFERLETALRYGADAVYLGSTAYGMRASAASFDLESLKKAAALAHQKGARLYLTCNTLPRNDEFEGLPRFLRDAADAGVDAFIVTDLGVLSLLRESVPGAEIHISTQAGVVNYMAAREFYKMGAKRVVLARELSLEEIATIRDKTPPDLEIEVFVHGAMCLSFSGRCVLSNYMAARDANRGQCAQPCRWKYTLMEEKRPGQYFPVFEDQDGTYILNAKDLCLLPYIDKLAEAGVTSLKIEGRAKSAYYVAAVTNAYRIAVDEYYAHPEGWKLPEWLSEEVRKVSHRDYSTGFLFGRPEAGQRYDGAGYIRLCDVAAVIDRVEGERVYCTQKNRFFDGDELELMEPGKQPVRFKISGLQNGDGEPIPDTRHPAMAFSFPLSLLPHTPQPGSILRKNMDA